MTGIMHMMPMEASAAYGGVPSPTFPLEPRCRPRIHDGKACGVTVCRDGRGRLERCELWDNANGGVVVAMGGGPTLAACTLRDHARGRAAVHVGAGSNATVGADCVFARNGQGDVVRA